MITAPRQSKGFTIVEVMLAIMMFGLIIMGIYSVWSVIIQGSKAGMNAAAAAQRARISIRAIEEALTTAQMFSANGTNYLFLADTSSEKNGTLEFSARLPASFPGVGRYGNVIVRRVRFEVDGDRNLIMTQKPLLAPLDFEAYRMQLAKDVTLFMFEFWDDQKKEYTSEWAYTNQLPIIVRVALGLGKAGNSPMPQDLETRTIAMPCTAIKPQWQNAPLLPPGVQPKLP